MGVNMWLLLAVACGDVKENPCVSGTVRTAPHVCEVVSGDGSAAESPAPPDSGDGNATDTGSPIDGDTAEPTDVDPAADEADAMANAATTFLDSLDAAQRDAAQFDLTDSERSAWSNLPVGDFPREGARIGDMTDGQQTLAWSLVEASLSARGKQRIDEILTMESIVEAIGWGSASLDDYFFVVFDVPSSTSPWGWQLDGHHLALNFTVVGSDVTMTPSLWGVEPVTWDEGEYAGLEPMVDEVVQGLTWANLLSTEQLEVAAQGPGGDPALEFGPQTDPTMWPSIQGLGVSDMTLEQREALVDLIAVYVGNLPTHQAENRMREIRDTLDEVSVVWVGEAIRGSAIYYRIHGPHVLIEFDHVMGPNHIHSVYRDPSNDYGADWLSKHLAIHHADELRTKGLGAWARTDVPHVH